MQTCPACQRSIETPDVECPYCGIVFAKWQRRRARLAPPVASTAPPQSLPTGRRARRSVGVAGLGILLGLGVVVIFWWANIRGRTGESGSPSRGLSVEVVSEPVSDFDRTALLPGGPRGMTSAGHELLVGNREEPWGFLRLEPRGESRFSLRKEPVIERSYGQRMSFDAVAWNGLHYIGYTQGDWFQRSGRGALVTLDADFLEVLDFVDAPPGIGCLAWTGNGYWAATRKNTRDADEEAYLYHFARDFRELGRYDSPRPGCQGLAWDGSRLWLVDVFSDDLLAIDVAGSKPEVVFTYPTRFRYLSGIAYHDGHLWLSEYGDNQLLRLNPQLQTAWTHTLGGTAAALAQLENPSARGGGNPLPPEMRERSSAEELAALHDSLQRHGQAERERALDAGDADALRSQLRHEDWAERLDAKQELERHGLGVDYARAREDDRGEPGPREARVLDWILEARDGSLYGSWEIFFGRDLFSSQRESGGPVSVPLFVKYSVIIEGGDLARAREVDFDARPGTNERQGSKLAGRLPPGRYTAYLHLHIQYVDEEGTPVISNQSSRTLEVDV